MGKIKSKMIRRTANNLSKKGVEFTDSFEENKRLINGITPSKKIRNQIAGLLAKLKKTKSN